MKRILLKAIKILEEEKTQLLKWAKQSEFGGWSTHQVDPMKKRAAYLYNKINELKVKMNEHK
jgi:hypothetical protein